MKIKKLIASALALTIIGGTAPTGLFTEPISAYAADDFTEVTEEGVIYHVYKDHAVAAGYDETLGTYILFPDSVEGVPLTVIGEEAFADNENITCVNIPDTVTTLEDECFSQCTGLLSVHLPKYLDNWGYATFRNCEALNEVNIPENIDYIGRSAFNNCYDLETVKIPITIHTICDSAFSGCRSMTEIELPYSITTLEAFAFSSSGLKSISIPDAVEEIGSYALSNCRDLETIRFSPYTRIFGQLIVSSTPWLENARKENEIIVINDQIIDGWNVKGDYVVPDNITGICGTAFSSNYNITSVVLPESVEHIDYCSFGNCTALESVTFLNPECDIYDYEATIYNKSEGRSRYFTGIIYGYTDSTAQAFAKKHYMTFIPLDGDPSEYTTTTKNTETTTTTTTTTTKKTTTSSETTTTTTSEAAETITETTTTTKTTKKTTTSSETTTTTTSEAAETITETTTTAKTTKKTTTSSEATTTTTSEATETTTETTTSSEADTTTTTETTLPADERFVGTWELDFFKQNDQKTVFDESNITIILNRDYTGTYDNSAKPDEPTRHIRWSYDGDEITMSYIENDVYYASQTLTYREDAVTFTNVDGDVIYYMKRTEYTPKTGDVDGDGFINAVDASKILVFYAALNADEAVATEKAMSVYDINKDNIINAIDASLVLAYYANINADPYLTLEAFLADKLDK